MSEVGYLSVSHEIWPRILLAQGPATLSSSSYDSGEAAKEHVRSGSHEVVPTFIPMTDADRSGIKIHKLYGTDQTGPRGPSAALVRYEPGSKAGPHLHSGYELILVLDGELRAGDAIYPKHSLVVLEPGTHHAPYSECGASLLVVWEQPPRPVASGRAEAIE